MADRELTMEQKNYMSSLANITPKYSIGQLRQIKNAFLKGMSIQEVDRMFTPDADESRMEQIIEQFLGKSEAFPLPAVKEENKTKNTNTVAEERREVYMEVPSVKEETPNRNARAEPEKKEAEIEKIPEEAPGHEKVQEHKTKGDSEVSEDIEEVLAMAKDAINRLNEVKAKYEAMDEFIHKHVLEEKDREIAMLQKENEKLKEELQNAIRAAPYNKIDCYSFMPRRFELLKFRKKNNSKNYIIKLFSNPKFTAEQISEIRLGLEADLDEAQIKSYARQEISARQMKEIRMLYELQNRKQREGGKIDGNTE